MKLVGRGRIVLEASPESGATGEPALEPEPPPPTLTAEQEQALAPIIDDVDARRFSTTLLLGITGSGKTEVYLRAIARALERGRGAIVLVPEIALTPQTERRFRARFGDDVAVLHSRQGGARSGEWERVRAGKARVVVGPRSAVFAPVRDLGLVVVDEEHETSYKQENAPRYHARDTAIVRAKLASAPVVLGSATPSLESWENARRGRYRLARLRQRPTGALLPTCEIVDLAEEWRDVKGAPLLSRRLVTLLEEALGRGERAILYVNRRGFTTFLHCPRCGTVAKCPRCDIALAFHKKENATLCHFCHHRAPPPEGPCPTCGGPPLRQRGAGTERVEDAFRARFPGVSCARLDSDALREGERLEDVLAKFRSGAARVLVGTQMVAKGLDVHDVTVVGVISADTGLSLPDFRAAERTFQLVAQVAGRAGRGSRPGRTVIQTFSPDHPAIALAAKHDFESFAESELAARRALGYPPFGRLLKVLVRGERDERVRVEAERLVLDLKDSLDEKRARVLGPAPSPRAYLAGRFRWQALVKASSAAVVRELVARLEGRKLEAGVDLAVDVDPYFLL
jgi:primosomal protein N' (replication factor Y)